MATFSFAGLKTAVVNHVRRDPEGGAADVAASFQEAVVDQLVDKLVAGADAASATTLVLGGGVTANSRLHAASRRSPRQPDGGRSSRRPSCAPTTGR